MTVATMTPRIPARSTALRPYLSENVPTMGKARTEPILQDHRQSITLKHCFEVLNYD